VLEGMSPGQCQPKSSKLCDLRTGIDNTIVSWAPVTILALMLYPRKSNDRRRFIDRARSDPGGRARREAEDATKREVRTAASMAMLSGAILLELVHLHMAGRNATLNEAMRRISDIWVDEHGVTRGTGSGRQRNRLLAAWHEYRPVAHLWATVVLSEMREIRTGQAFSPLITNLQGELAEADLIAVLQIADWLAVEATKVRIEDKKRRRRIAAMEQTSSWRFHLPARFAPDPEWRPNLPDLDLPASRNDLKDIIFSKPGTELRG